MSQLRVEKVQEFIKQEISKIIMNDIKDPRVKNCMVTVTQVAVTGDLRSAKIYVSLMGSKEQNDACWIGLNKALGFMRSEIGKRIRLRFNPELSLQLDESLQYSAHIQTLLNKIQREEAER